MNCRKITTRFWCMISSTQWVFMWTYLCLLLRIRTLSSWWYNFSVANSFCAKNKASKSSHNFTAFVLRQNQFYSIGPQWGERSITWANALFRIFRVAARSLTDWVSEWVSECSWNWKNTIYLLAHFAPPFILSLPTTNINIPPQK